MTDIECIGEDSPLLGVQEVPSDDLTKDSQQPETENPVSFLSRALALLLMSAVGFGAFFCFDNPGALQNEIRSSLNVSTAEFADLYSCYSWPNAVLPVLGGLLIDSVFGLRLGTVLFTALMCAGQLLLGLGALKDCFWLMKLSRFIFGLGGESLNMALNTYIVTWFRGKELNLVFGLQLSLGRLGSTVNFLVMGKLYTRLKQSDMSTTDPLGNTLLVASCFTFMSLICSLLLGFMDRKRANGVLPKTGEVQTVPTEPMRLSDLKHFPLSFWLLCLTTLTYYGSIFPFISLGQGMFQTKFGQDADSANLTVGLVYLIAACGSPVLGWLLDRTGRLLAWVTASLLLSCAAHLTLALTSLSPLPAIITMGLTYSVLSSALWSLPCLMVSQNKLATAFGIMQALQNLGTALITLGAGWIVDTWGYTHLELFFSGWLLASLVSGLGVWGLGPTCHTPGVTGQAPHKQGPAHTYGSVEREEEGPDLSLRGL